MTTSFDARKTGWTIEDCVQDVEKMGDDPYRQYYYVTYADTYHTDPDCPHIQHSESLHVTGRLSTLNGPLVAGENRIASHHDDDLEECSWCAARTDWKFAPDHRPRILDAEKRATLRLGARAERVSPGDTFVFRTVDGDVFGTAPVEAVEQTTVSVVVRNGVDGHRDYQSIEAVRREFRKYYPRKQIIGGTELSNIEWGDVTPRTEGDL